MNLLMDDDGVRPAGPPDRCLYCGAPKGKHNEDCVCLKKSVVIEARIKFVDSVPRHWDEHSVNFHRNESSWCQSNFLHDLTWLDQDAGCLCGNITFEYIGEATPEDHAELPDLTKRKG